MKLRFPRDGRRSRPPKKSGTALKIRLCGKDDAPLTMRELREGLLEAARQLKDYEAMYRAKSITLYLTLIDEDGRPIRINDSSELTIRAYKAAADELGV
jgi:hypothetical protein